MSQRNRALAALGAVVVLVAAFLVLRPSDDDKDTNNAAATATATVTAPALAATTPTTATAPTTTTTTAAKPPAPKVTTVRAVDLEPAGGVKTIKVDKNDTVRFVVTSDRPESVHLHGYDVEKPVGPGRPARYTFKANIEGIFEVELEESGNQLIKLVVNP